MKKEAATIIHERKLETFKNECFMYVHYFINEKKKTVVCKLKPWCTESQSLMHCPNVLADEVETRQAFFKICGEFEFSFVGKAVCQDSDEFDIEFGKKLAYDKASLKMIDKKKKVLSYFIEYFEDIIENIVHEIDNTDALEKRVRDRFDKKIKEISK